MTHSTYVIDYLTHHQDHVPLVGQWVWQEWEQHMGRSQEYCIEEIRQDGCNIDRLNLTLIALKDGKCVGTVQLMKDDCLDDYAHLSPWLGSFYIDPAARSLKLALDLCNRIKKEAARLSYESCYIHTYNLQKPIIRNGGIFIGKSTYANRNIDVFSLPISGR